MEDADTSPLALRFLMSLSDFNEAWRTAIELQRVRARGGGNSTTERALWAFAVISYVRPFSGNDCGTAPYTSNPSIKASWMTPEQKRVHSRLTTMRHELMAHSDPDAMKPTLTKLRSVPGAAGVRFGTTSRFGLPTDAQIAEFVVQTEAAVGWILQAGSAVYSQPKGAD